MSMKFSKCLFGHKKKNNSKANSPFESHEASSFSINVTSMIQELERVSKQLNYSDLELKKKRLNQALEKLEFILSTEFKVDKNGFISAEEILRVMRKRGREYLIKECENIIRNLDPNANGMIKFKEFKRKLMALGSYVVEVLKNP
ncbi:hypothetical protein AAG906_019762 [Vitis piasezkii]